MSESKVRKSFEQVRKLISDLGDPAKMSKREWIEFLSEIEDDCSAQREATEQELKEEDGEDDD